VDFGGLNNNLINEVHRTPNALAGNYRVRDEKIDLN